MVLGCYGGDFQGVERFSFKTIHECKCVWASVVRDNQDLVVANALICFRHRVWGLTCLKKAKSLCSHLFPAKSTEISDSVVCNELTQWIEQALKSAVHASGNRIQLRNGDSIPSSEVSSSPSSPSSTPPHSPFKEVLPVDKQYRRHPVNSQAS